MLFTSRKLDGLREEQWDLHLLPFDFYKILASRAFAAGSMNSLFLQKQFLKCGYFTFDLVQKQQGQASCAPWER